jgi:hypothetical protein
MSFALLLALTLVSAERPDARAASPGAASADAPAQERPICRRRGGTGSLVKRGRVCLPLSEWQRLSELQRRASDVAGTL